MEKVRYSLFSHVVLVLIASILFVGHGLHPQEAERNRSSESEDQTRETITPEQRILTRIHQITEIGIDAAQSAREQGESKWVRTYGAQLIRDHELAARRVRDIASRENIALTTENLDANKPREQLETPRQLIKQLASADGEEFDKLFLKSMVMLHRHSIDVLTEAVDRLENETVRRFIEQLVPIMDQHRRLARHIQTGEVT